MGAFLHQAAATPLVIQTTVSIGGIHCLYLSHTNPKNPPQTINCFLSHCSPALLLYRRRRRRRSTVPHHRAVSFHSSSHADSLPSNQIPNRISDSILGGLLERLQTWRHFLPGGSWWLLQGNDEVEEGKGRWSKGVTVVQALRRMWFLVSGGRRVIFLAFASLFVASLSEISIPHFLTASIFSAQSGESTVFYNNAKILVSLCLVSGIFSGLRSCFFSIANMILVKKMREVLYSTLLFQEMALFDEETVGDLTSRLGSDCQQVSRVIGNDLNLICRNALQGAGALIVLFTISWPLALSMVLLCASLAAVLYFYGRFQKRVSKLIQDFTARANEVSRETFSLIRSVRVYGTENREIERYTTWLVRLWDISLRQSMGYGFWSLSYNFFYHSTQVVAVLIGGISILCGHTTAEQLTKFILYAEWLIYSVWWIGDNWSSLMQSIGASEKVFQLMDLLPRKKLISGGMCLLLIFLLFYMPSH